MMTMVACSDCAGINDILRALKRSADRRTGVQSSVASDIGVELARVIAGLAPISGGRVDAGRLARMTSRIGGSNEQRDVFLRTLALIAADAGDQAGTESVLALRASLKRETRFARLVATRLDQGVERLIVREVA